MIRRQIEKVVDFGPGEFGPAVLGALYFFFLLFGYFMLRPLRDAMGVEGGIDSLQVLFLVTLGVMVLANIAFSVVASRLPRRVFVPLVYWFAIACLGGFLALFLVLGDERSVVVGRVFYVWLSVFNLFAVTVFWGFMADIFTQPQGKRLFGFIGVGGTAGAICGSLWTGGLARAIGEVGLFASAMVLIGAASLVAVLLGRLATRRGMSVGSAQARPSVCTECGYPSEGLDVDRCPECGAADFGAGRPSASRPLGGAGWSGVADVARSPYLMGIAAYVCLFTVLSTLLYFEKMRLVAAFTDDAEARAALLAWIELGGQTATILLQLFVTGRLIKRFGVGAMLAVVPMVTVVGFVGFAAAPALLFIALFEATRRASNFALSKPARETLFTVVSRSEKYKAKSFIDTFVYRGGDSIGTLAHMGVGGFGVAVAWLAVPLGLAALGLSFWLGGREESVALSKGRGGGGSDDERPVRQAFGARPDAGGVGIVAGETRSSAVAASG
jgi:AAA family ATP:ADP antiporter